MSKANMLNKDKLKTELHNYKEVGIYKNVARNHHMNEVEDDFDDEKAGRFLDGFVERTNINEEKPSDGLTKLVVEAKNQRKNLYQRMPQVVVDAVLVDYINYVAMSYGIDYALYTKDIR